MAISIPDCPTWYDLRGLGRSPISRMTILIPVFGSLILFSTAANDFINLSADFLGMEQEDAAQISRRNSLFLYFGLLIFSVSTLAYNALCPMVIKEFKTEYDYYEAESKIITKDRAKRLQEHLNRDFEADLGFDFDLTAENQTAARALGFQDNTTSENREFWLRAKSQPVADLFQAHYTIENISKIKTRRAIYGAYLVSFGFIAVPTATTLWKVLQALF